LTRHDALTLAVSGLFLWVGGNGLVNLAEQRAASGLAALLVSSTPIWTALIESVLDRRPPTIMLVVALAIGLGGVGLLSASSFSTDGTDATTVAALLGASLTWAIGSVLQHRRPVTVEPLVSAGYQLLFGGIGLAAARILAREPIPSPSSDAWLAWLYLVVFGSLIAFTSFVQVLRLLPTSLAMTYAYVNPAIAVLLGVLILQEPFTISTAAGMLLILLGVAGVFQARRHPTTAPDVRVHESGVGSG
jgi:drug/metabolite transporter (DMT)-like permease